MNILRDNSTTCPGLLMSDLTHHGLVPKFTVLETYVIEK